MSKLSKKIGDRAGLELAKLLSAPEAVKTTVDAKGRVVRVDAPTYEEIQSFFWNLRAIDEFEALEVMGPNSFTNHVKSGSLKRDEFGWYWLTTKAAYHYALPDPVVGGTRCKFVEA